MRYVKFGHPQLFMQFLCVKFRRFGSVPARFEPLPVLPLENSNTMNPLPTSSSGQNFHLGIGTLAQKNLSWPPETNPPDFYFTGRSNTRGDLKAGDVIKCFLIDYRVSDIPFNRIFFAHTDPILGYPWDTRDPFGSETLHASRLRVKT